MGTDGKSFKIGDRVRRINRENGARVPIGSIGTVKEFRPNNELAVQWDHLLWDHLLGSDGDECICIRENLALIEPPKPKSKFKIGDRVRCLDDGFSFYGSLGTVKEIEDGVYMVEVDNQGSELWNHFERELEFAGDEIKSKPLQFKIGDRVTGQSNIDTIETGEIIEIDEGSVEKMTYRIKCKSDMAEVWMIDGTLTMAPIDPNKLTKARERIAELEGQLKDAGENLAALATEKANLVRQLEACRTNLDTAALEREGFREQLEEVRALLVVDALGYLDPDVSIGDAIKAVIGLKSEKCPF